MKKINLHIVLIIFAIAMFNSYGQGILVNDRGTIQNNGTMRVNSDGTVRGLPDTLGGRVEFISDVPGISQTVPNIAYKELYITGRTRKKVSTDIARPVNKPMLILDSLIVNGQEFMLIDSVDIEVLGYLGLLSEISGRKQVIMKREISQQDVSGAGKVRNLTIDNISGVDVINGGGFTVGRKLTLLRGELRNSAENNLIMADSSLIERNVGASIAFQPQFEGGVSLSYVGDGEITTGAEVPVRQEVLQELFVENSFGLNLDRNMTVNDSIYVRHNVRAIEDTLTFTNSTNPNYNVNNPDAEIAGNFRRTNLPVGDTLILNNRNSYVYFDDEESRGSVRSLVSSIFPRTYHLLPQGDELKVRRAYSLFGFDELGGEVVGGFNMQYQFAWRDAPNNDFVDETRGLVLDDLVLQKWIENEWIDLDSDVPTILPNNWAAGKSNRLDEFGVFAVGYSAANNFNFALRLFLEGPYNRTRKAAMRTHLWERNLLATLPAPNQYPVSLDPNYNPEFISVPDSVVDIVVIGFRADRNAIDGEFYKTAFLRNDGRLVDIRGRDRIRLTINDGIDKDGGSYWITVHHRNHATIISSAPVDVLPGEEIGLIDFATNPQLVEGGAAGGSLVRVDILEDGTNVYALKAGFFFELGDQSLFNSFKNADLFETAERDYIAPWRQYTNEGYLYEDFDLNGIITTKDFNISWNNRAR